MLQASADAISPNGFRTVMEIDALGTFAASRAAFPALKASGDAAIINITATLQYGATWWQVIICEYSQTGLTNRTHKLYSQTGLSGVGFSDSGGRLFSRSVLPSRIVKFELVKLTI